MQANKAREFFVIRQVAAKVLDACIDAEWRLLFALARFGGLRTPSEPLALTWADVDWERNRLWIRCVNTERHERHGERIIPLHAVRPYLEAVFDAAPEGSTYVINRYRNAKQNLRTQLKRTIRTAGLTPWPRLWQNLRASCATELADEHPAHVAAARLGHSVSVANRHYWQATDADFEKTARKQAQHAPVGVGTPEQEKRETLNLPSISTECESLLVGRRPRQESNL